MPGMGSASSCGNRLACNTVSLRSALPPNTDNRLSELRRRIKETHERYPLRWKSRLVPAAAVAIVATAGAIAPATIASASSHPKLQATTLSIKNKAIAHSKHHADLITGVLKSHRKGVAGETITLDSRTGKKPRWVSAGTATTG